MSLAVNHFWRTDSAFRPPDCRPPDRIAALQSAALRILPSGLAPSGFRPPERRPPLWCLGYLRCSGTAACKSNRCKYKRYPNRFGTRAVTLVERAQTTAVLSQHTS